MTQANWIKGITSSTTGFLCCLSAAAGVSVGLGIAAWNSFAVVEPVLRSSSLSEHALAIQELDAPLQPFFPELGRVEAAVAAVELQNAIRADQMRQQQLEQTIDVLKFNGSTAEDIAKHVEQRLVDELVDR